jgi:hypothetical protein
VTAPPRGPEPAIAEVLAGEIARIRHRWTTDLIAELVERPDTIWQVEPVLAALNGAARSGS